MEQKFRTLKDADNRALGGLSMGGGQTVAIGFANPDTFHNLVVMSAGGTNVEQNYPAFFKDPAATNKKLKLLWVGVGKEDKLVMAGTMALKESLTKAPSSTRSGKRKGATSGWSGAIISARWHRCCSVDSRLTRGL